jgi:membrane protein DedA with SNARE-associated domain
LGSITHFLEGLHGPVIYAIVAALVFGEAALFFGFVLPGETAVVIGGLLASEHRVSLPVLIGLVVVSAVAGDSVGYEIGRKFGPRLLQTRPMRKYEGGVGKAQAMIRKRGPLAVFIGRFTALLRALMPALVGVSRMPYPRFLLFNFLGALTWGTGYTIGGYYAGKAFEHAASAFGRYATIGIGVVVVAALVVWGVRRRRKEHAEATAPAAKESPEKSSMDETVS